ncbi:MAG: LVIVD repeat-containing protein, partial [Rubripirellula sp.]
IIELDSFSTSDQANFVLAYSDRVYVADGTAGVRILDDGRSEFDPPQNIYVVGEVLNENGDLVIRNRDGGISISGSTRSANTTIESAGNFTLNAEAWFHSNTDPRQYVDLNQLRQAAFDAADGRKLVVGDSDEWRDDFLQKIEKDVSIIRALGSVDITAQFINVNGLIQSGSPDLVLNIQEGFAPAAFTSLADEDGNPVAGVDFGTQDQIPVDAFFDPSKNKITVKEIKASGGKINLTGRILSTGYGELRVSDGQTALTVNNQSSYDLEFESIDLTGAEPGEIIITDLLKGSDSTIHRTTYTGGVSSFGAASAATVEIGTLVCEAVNNPGTAVTCPTDGNLESITQRIAYTADPALSSATARNTYQPVADSYYAWTEGQSKTETTVTKYEQKSFNLFGGGTSFEDFLSSDSGYTSRDIVYTDAQPLLESETLLNRDSAEGRELMDSVFGTTDANPTPTANYGVKYHLAELETPREYEIEEWETGGGWMQEKVAHTKITEVQGVKDFYNHAILADHPINIVFDPGGASHSKDIQITTKGTGVHFGGMVKTGNSLIGLTNEGSGGSLTCADEVYIEGSQSASGFDSNECTISGIQATAEPALGGEQEALDLTVVNYDPATNSYSFSDTSHLLNFGGQNGVSVRTRGPITLNIVSSTNRDNRILVDRIESTGGNVFINAPHGIYAADANSLIRGKEITLLANEGPIGGSHALNLDSDGVVEVSAESHIWLREQSGDLEIVEVRSQYGEVVLETVDGAIVNRNINKVFLSEEEIDEADRQQALSGERAANVARQEMQLEETSETRAYHAYWQNYRTFSAAVSEAGSFDTTGNAQAIAVAGTTAYVADGVGGLRVLDVTDLSSITELGAYDAATNAKSIAIQGNVAYLANGGAGLLVLDITDPAAITKLGSFDTAGDAKAVVIQGATAYVADGTNGLLLLDVSDPANITQISRFVSTPTGDSQSIAIAGTKAYLANGTKGLHVLNIEDPAAIAELGSFTAFGNATSVAIRDTTAYVTDASYGLRVLDITDHGAITEQGSFDTTGSANSVSIQGVIAYVADGVAGLRALDVSNPTAIIELDSFSTSDQANFVLA